MNNIGLVSARMGQYLDCFLEPSVTSTKAYLKDTKDFLLCLSKIKLPKESEIYLVTANVSSLYIIIQHDDALLALNWVFSQREDIPYIQKKILKWL